MNTFKMLHDRTGRLCLSNESAKNANRDLDGIAIDAAKAFRKAADGKDRVFKIISKFEWTDDARKDEFLLLTLWQGIVDAAYKRWPHGQVPPPHRFGGIDQKVTANTRRLKLDKKMRERMHQLKRTAPDKTVREIDTTNTVIVKTYPADAWRLRAEDYRMVLKLLSERLDQASKPAPLTTSQQRAWSSYRWVEDRRPDITNNDAYQMLEENGCEFYDDDNLPNLETWKRYVRGARMKLGRQKKHRPRR